MRPLHRAAPTWTSPTSRLGAVGQILPLDPATTGKENPFPRIVTRHFSNYRPQQPMSAAILADSFNAPTLMENATEKAVLDLLRRSIARVVSYVLPLIVVVAPSLYFIGRVHREAYWRALEVPPGVMTQTSEDYIYSGFALLISTVLRVFSWLPLGAIGIWLALTIFALGFILLWFFLKRMVGRCIRKQLLISRRAERKASTQQRRPILPNVAAFWPVEWLNRSLFGFLFSLLLVISLVDLADRTGVAYAQQDRKDITLGGKVGGFNRRAIAHLRGQEHDQSGAVLRCSTAWCALARRGEVIVVPVNDIERLDHCPKGIRLANQQWTCDTDAIVTP